MDSLAKKIADAIGKYHVGFMRKKVLKTVEEIEATTDQLEKYVAGADSVAELNNKLTTKLPDDVKLIVEGSGADVKYYAQLGADAASKKLLGSKVVTKTVYASSGQTITLTADKDITAASLVCTTNQAFQCAYDNVNGSIHGYGSCSISVSGRTISAYCAGYSGNWRISYC